MKFLSSEQKTIVTTFVRRWKSLKKWLPKNKKGGDTVYTTVPEPARGDLITFRKRGAETFQMAEVIHVNKRHKRVLVETGIKGAGKNIVETISRDRIFNIRRPVKVRVKTPL